MVLVVVLVVAGALFGYIYVTNTNTISSLNKRVAALEAQSSAANATIAADSAKIIADNSLISKLQGNITSLKSQVSQESSTIQSLEGEVSQDQLQIQMLEGQVYSLQFQIYDLQRGCVVITTNTTLSANIGPCYGSGIIVGASHIVLDCAGHTINGTGRSPAGVLLIGISDVTVENCNVMGFAYGFQLIDSSSNTLAGNTADNNSNGLDVYPNTGYGFWLENSSKNTLTKNTADYDGSGFGLSNSSSNTLSGNTADKNTYWGFYLSGTSISTLSGNTADNNKQYGYYDTTTGTGTAGTASTYSLDECSVNDFGGSSPSRLCSPQL